MNAPAANVPGLSAELGRLWRMTRPPFLAVTAVGYLLGLAIALHPAGSVQVAWPVLLGGLLVAVCAHAAANVLNDSEDHRNGADAGNTGAIAPFTGGAGMIQRGETTADATRRLAVALGIASVLGGLFVAMQGNTALLAMGALGLLAGWAYSAPPLALMARGLGEPAIALAWMLVVLGAATLASGRLLPLAAIAGLGYGLLVTAILVVNSVPDAPSDAAAGKATLCVRLGAPGAARLHLACMLVAHAIALALAVWLRAPALLAAQATLPLALWASGQLWRHRHAASALRPAIVATILTAALHGLLLALGLWRG